MLLEELGIIIVAIVYVAFKLLKKTGSGSGTDARLLESMAEIGNSGRGEGEQPASAAPATASGDPWPIGEERSSDVAFETAPVAFLSEERLEKGALACHRAEAEQRLETAGARRAAEAEQRVEGGLRPSHSAAAEPVVTIPDYANYTLVELYEGLSSIRSDLYPEVYSALDAELGRRKSTSRFELEQCYYALDKKRWPDHAARLRQQMHSLEGEPAQLERDPRPNHAAAAEQWLEKAGKKSAHRRARPGRYEGVLLEDVQGPKPAFVSPTVRPDVSTMAKLKPAEFRKAFVLSELLQSPVSLRREQAPRSV